MNWEMVQGFVRHLLTFGGGFAVTAGYMTETDLAAGVGAIVTLAGIVWSVMVKRKTV